MADLKQERHYIIGYIGSDRLSYARKLADELSCPVLIADDEIERLDGRKIKNVVMIHGEHSYRNMEYDLLSKLSDPSYDHGIAKNETYPEKLVIVCGDGMVLDDMSFEILKREDTIFIDEPVDVLWERSKNDSSTPYFFMSLTDEEEKKKTFFDFYERRLKLYREASGC